MSERIISVVAALIRDNVGRVLLVRKRGTAAFMQPGGKRDAGESDVAALSEPRDAIEEIIEPFLIQKGFLQRTPRGRLITGHAFKHLGLAEPARDPSQFGLFGGDESE